MKTIIKCKGLKILEKLGIVKTITENIDEKGFTTTINFICKDNTPITIKYCPCCGKLIQNTNVPLGECEIIKEV